MSKTTAEELIEFLKKFPGETCGEVCIAYSSGSYGGGTYRDLELGEIEAAQYDNPCGFNYQTHDTWEYSPGAHEVVSGNITYARRVGVLSLGKES